MEVTIGSIDDVLLVNSLIPEFESNGKLENKINHRLLDIRSLILVARIDGEVVGYKIGYEVSSSTFYSWLGGVIPGFRRLGTATQLREYQESWAKQSGYSEIKVKSMNRFPSMLQLLISSGYTICGYEEGESKGSGKIVFSKELG